jgi:hypothetical protein
MTGCLGSVCQRGQARRRVALAGLVGLLAACGPAPIHGSNSINRGVIPVSQAATYDYALTLTSGDSISDVLWLSNDLGGSEWFTPPSDGEAGSGSVYLGAGNWTGRAGWTQPADAGMLPAPDGGTTCVAVTPDESASPTEIVTAFCSDPSAAWSLTLTSS